VLIDTVVFDFGNVLVHWDARLAYVNEDPEVVEDFFNNFDFMEWNKGLDSGQFTFAEARALVAETQPHYAQMLDVYFQNYDLTLAGSPVAGTVELVQELKNLGLRLFGRTNWWADTFHYADAATPAIGMMDDTVVSGRVKLAKPGVEIFELLIDRCQLIPDKTLFVDDSAANCATAKSLGFITHQFTDAPALRQCLLELGVSV
jgi:2-haloacid dehalogenase